MIGKQLGGYVIQAELGKGGMGVVYRATQIKLNRAVALKLLPPQFTMDQGFIRRFRREAQAIARLNHPNIVQVYDIGEDNGTQFYAMELVEGETVDDKLVKQGHLSVRDSASILAGVCRGLHVAHEAGIVHRDIKPANIIVAEDGTPKLMDFGIALQQTEERLTTTGGIVGTPEYMSPEQANGLDVTSVSDIYSLGIVFYEMLTGQVPFENEKPMVTLQQQAFEEPTPPRSFVPDIPEPIEQIVLKMLAKDPANRYADCLDVIRDLRTLSTGGATLISAAGIDSTGARSPFAEKPRSRSRAPLLFAGVLGLVVLAAAGLYTSQGSTPPPPSDAPPIVTVSDRELEQQLIDLVVARAREEAARERYSVRFKNGGVLKTQEAEGTASGARVTLAEGDVLTIPDTLLADPPIEATAAPDLSRVAATAREQVRSFLLGWKSEHGYAPLTPEQAATVVTAFGETLQPPQPNANEDLLSAAWMADYELGRAERAAQAATARVERLRSEPPNTDSRFPDQVVMHSGRRMQCRILDNESTFETLLVALADGGRMRLAFSDIRYVDRAYGSAEQAAETAAEQRREHQRLLRSARKRAAEEASALAEAQRRHTAALQALAESLAPATSPTPGTPEPEPPVEVPEVPPVEEDPHVPTALWSQTFPFGLLPTAGVGTWRASDACETGVDIRGDGTGGLWMRSAGDRGFPSCFAFAMYEDLELSEVGTLTADVQVQAGGSRSNARLATWIEVDGRGVRPLAYVLYSNADAITDLPTGVTAPTPPIAVEMPTPIDADTWGTVTLPVAADWLAAGAGESVELTAIRLVHYHRGFADGFTSGFRGVSAWPATASDVEAP